MLNFFHRLKVSQKLMLISIIFLIPDSVLLILFLSSVNQNIRFAQWERHGNEYQRPLEELLENLPKHLWLARRTEGDTGQTEELTKIQARVEAALARLETVDAKLGEKLQFTDEGLAKRKREHCRVRNLKTEWEQLRSNLRELKPSECMERHLHLIADVRTMITHVGDTSNLILDPDLDSYYLMDVTLLALPQMQDRMATVVTFGEHALSDHGIAGTDQIQLAVYAALLKEADMDRVEASTRTALNEDANFYGNSESLQTRVLPALHLFAEAAERFVALTRRLSEPAPAKTDLLEFWNAGMKARDLSFALWKVADEELDVLLAKRMKHYRARRARSLILTAFALSGAICFVAFITRSISGPLQKQATALRKSNVDLQAEVAERKRMEEALREAEEKYRSIFENAVGGIFQTSPEGVFIAANPTLARIYGYESVSDLQAGLTDIGHRLYVDPSRRTEFQRLMNEFGSVHGFESQVTQRDGGVIWISETARAVRDTAGTLLYYEGTVEDITQRKRSEAELEKVHRKLVDASRMAGMAEVATGVLHNVGNVLNSVNVSASLVSDTLRKSKLPNLAKAAGMLREHAADLGQFLSTDPRGSKIPGYLGELADHLTQEQGTMLKRMDLLRSHLEHIKEIVAMQQNYAKVSGVTETMKVTELVEDALRLNAGALSRHQVEVKREYEAEPTIVVDKHKALQVLVNLIGNAKYACVESSHLEKQLTLRVVNGADRVKISVADNGIGIPQENLIRIFNHGFTTRKDGHGFGLHSGALAAKEMGGSLTVESGGLGRGATFTLDLPLQARKASHG